MNQKKSNKKKTIMEKYILTTMFMLFGLCLYAQTADTEKRDGTGNFAVNYSVIIPKQTTHNISVVLSNSTTEIQQPAEAPSDGGVHTMTLFLLNNTQVTYNKEDLDNVTYLPGVGMKLSVKGNAKSVDYLYSQMSKIEYVINGSSQ
jgi:hypothetical protein